MNAASISYLAGESLSTGATVSLIAYTQVVGGLGIVPDGYTDCDALAEFAGRWCYDSQDRMGEAPGFVAARIREGHESTIEHASATFLLDGISRACSLHIARHRLASISQKSQRYVDLRRMYSIEGTRREVVERWCIIPEGGFEDDEVDSLHHSIMQYVISRERKTRKERARYLLPECVRTSKLWSANMREWRHIIRVRGSTAAQDEIREVVGAIERQLRKIAPKTFEE